MNYNNIIILIGIQFGYFIIGVLTASIIGSIGYGIWLFLNCGTAKFSISDGMKHLRLTLLGFLLPIIPFIIYSMVKLQGAMTQTYMLTPMVNVLFVGGVIWLIFAIIKIVKYYSDYKVILDMTKKSKPLTKGPLLDVVEKWKQTLQISGQVGIYTNEDVRSPLLLYNKGYQILLPEYEMSEKEQYMAVLHELVHLKHKDILWKDISCFVNVLHGFNPIAWFVKNDIRKWTEVSCDLTACQVGSKEFSEQDYYHIILDMAGRVMIPEQINAVLTLFENKSVLNFRIDKYRQAKHQESFVYKSVVYLYGVGMIILSMLTTKGLMMTNRVWFANSINPQQKEEKMISLEETKTLLSEKERDDFTYEEVWNPDENYDGKKKLQEQEIWHIKIDNQKVVGVQIMIFTDAKDYIVGCVNQQGETIYVNGTSGAFVHTFEDDLFIEEIFIENRKDKWEFDVAAGTIPPK